VEPSACAVGRLGRGGPWIGFAPAIDDAYEIVLEDARRLSASPPDLLALAVLYFEDGLDEPPEEFAATHGDIGALVRHLADAPKTPDSLRAPLAAAVDAIDDGLAADVVIARLQEALPPGLDPRSHLAARITEDGAAGRR
jgi:hypothetical protein